MFAHYEPLRGVGGKEGVIERPLYQVCLSIMNRYVVWG